MNRLPPSADCSSSNISRPSIIVSKVYIDARQCGHVTALCANLNKVKRNQFAKQPACELKADRAFPPS